VTGQPGQALTLGPQDSILFHQIRDHVLLLPIEPAGEGGEEELKGGDVNNHGGESLLHRPKLYASGDTSAEF
jgi:hypothetical protein